MIHLRQWVEDVTGVDPDWHPNVLEWEHSRIYYRTWAI